MIIAAVAAYLNHIFSSIRARRAKNRNNYLVQKAGVLIISMSGRIWINEFAKVSSMRLRFR